MPHHSPTYRRLISNCKTWQSTRRLQLCRQPWCEECLHTDPPRRRWATIVHHRREVESAKSEAEARLLAYASWNLESVCAECHARIHNGRGYHTKAQLAERQQQKTQRFLDRFIKPKG